MANTRTQQQNADENPEEAGRRMAARILEVERERDALKERVRILEAEAAVRPGGERPAPVSASFGMSEGVRQELEEHRDDPNYKARDPFTGDALTVADLDKHQAEQQRKRGDR